MIINNLILINSSIYPQKLELVKKNAGKRETNFGCNIKIKDWKFQVGHFDISDLLPFCIVRMAEKWSNILSSLVYSAIGAELLRIVTGSNNSELFSIAIKPLVKRINRQGVSNKKTNRVILKPSNNHQRDFGSVCKSKQELLDLTSSNFVASSSLQLVTSVSLFIQIRQ